MPVTTQELAGQPLLRRFHGKRDLFPRKKGYVEPNVVTSVVMDSGDSLVEL